MTLQIATVIAVLLICGGLGGYSGYLLSPPNPDQLSQRRPAWWVWRAIVLGVVAAMLVPLFLKLVGAVVGTNGNLMEQVLSPDGTSESWFVFSGFCLVAAASAQRFVAAVTNTVLKHLQQEIEDTKEIARETREVVEELEDDQKLLAQPPARLDTAAQHLTEPELLLLRHMRAASNRRISPEDVAKATGVALNEVRQLLIELQQKGYVQRRDDAPNGTERWRIRTQGKAMLDELDDI